MEILLYPNNLKHWEAVQGKGDDEQIVRKTLAKVWIKILKKYAAPGAQIPPAEAVRRELLEVGVEAAAEAVADAHWWLQPFMVRDKIRRKVEKRLAEFHLADFIEDVQAAQRNPAMLADLEQKIKDYVM